jgi:hypothetical protein
MHKLPLLRAGVTIAVAALLMAVSFSPSATAQRDHRERTLFVGAVNEKGEPVEGLGPEAFGVK